MSAGSADDRRGGSLDVRAQQAEGSAVGPSPVIRQGRLTSSPLRGEGFVGGNNDALGAPPVDCLESTGANGRRCSIAPVAPRRRTGGAHAPALDGSAPKGRAKVATGEGRPEAAGTRGKTQRTPAPRRGARTRRRLLIRGAIVRGAMHPPMADLLASPIEAMGEVGRSPARLVIAAFAYSPNRPPIAAARIHPHLADSSAHRCAARCGQRPAPSRRP